ncbi:MAG: TRAP transporter substrate-binding protein [Lachnospiraceae bacterium]|nr:TRAP transporter substrate-binding protein [Lachnospiraceae bacterium]
MLKKYFLAAAVFCMTGLMSGCGSSSSGQTVTEIRVAFNQNENHPQYKAMKSLGEKFEEETNGRYHMTIYPNGVLGEQGAMAEFIRTGALQMAIVPCSVPESYDEDFAIVGTPYLYDGIDHMEQATLSGVFDDLFSSTDKYKFQVLTVYTAGERNVYAKKPINSADDLKGMIIRVNDSPTYIEMTRLMGGNGSVMAQSEVYTALQQGVIDAAENSELVYRDFKHYEVAPYYAYTRHIVHPDVVLASTDFLNSMTPEDRAIFDRLVKESAEEEFTTFKEAIEVAKKDAEENGAQFCYPDTEELRQKCMPLLERIANQSDVTKDIYDNIMALREENK